jgi:hypothetical protein
MGKQTTYVSRYFELKLVMDSSYFKEVNGKVLPVKGRSIRFTQGAYTTDDAEEIKFLDEHPNFGSIFIKVDKDAVEELADYVQTLEERNAELEAQLAEKNAPAKVAKKAPAKKTATKKAPAKKAGAKF